MLANKTGLTSVLVLLLSVCNIYCSGQRGMIGKEKRREIVGVPLNPTNHDGDPTDNNDPNPPADTQSTDSCSSNKDCPEGQHCNFPQGNSWAEGTQGECSPDCRTVDDCPELGQICVEGICYNDYECENNTQCPPDSVCRHGRCSPPPEECRFHKDCPQGWRCQSSRCVQSDNPGDDPNTPPDNGCYTDEDCPAGKYCESFTSQCEEGCRDDMECIGMCPGSNSCGCNSTHTCSGDEILENEQDCTLEPESCPVGTLCAPEPEVLGSMPCMLESLADAMGEGGGAGGMLGMGGMCPKTCRLRCDIALETMTGQATCPAGDQCQQPEGTMGFLLQLLKMTEQEQPALEDITAGVCYPAPAP